jgi:hypothetical protein
VFQHPQARLIPVRRNEQMTTVEQVKKAFRESRIAGEQLLSQGKIIWNDYAALMIGYELILKEMGEEL